MPCIAAAPLNTSVPHPSSSALRLRHLATTQYERVRPNRLFHHYGAEQFAVVKLDVRFEGERAQSPSAAADYKQQVPRPVA